jgi:hypothetical protein
MYSSRLQITSNRHLLNKSQLTIKIVLQILLCMTPRKKKLKLTEPNQKDN